MQEGSPLFSPALLADDIRDFNDALFRYASILYGLDETAIK